MPAALVTRAKAKEVSTRRWRASRSSPKARPRRRARRHYGANWNYRWKLRFILEISLSGNRRAGSVPAANVLLLL
jgi:hypothetical protein